MKTCVAAIALLLSVPALAADSYPVTTAPLNKVEVQATVHAYGRVAERPQYLYFKVAGRLLKLLADVGTGVSAGQVLAELDTQDVDNQLSQAREGLKHAEIKYKQIRELSSRKVASDDQLEDRRHALELQQLEIQHLQEQRERHFLKAPGAGRIVDRLVDFPGPVGADTAIFRFQGAMAPLLVEADLTQAEVQQVRRGDVARLTLPEAPATPLRAQVQRVRPAASATGLFSVDLAVDAPPADVALPAGAQVDVAITTSRRISGYALPITALLAIDGNEGRFFVVDKQRAKAVSAPLTHIDGDRVLLDKDLSAYSRAVVRGQYQLTDGALLKEMTSAK